MWNRLLRRSGKVRALEGTRKAYLCVLFVGKGMDKNSLEISPAISRDVGNSGPEWLFVEAASPSMRAVEAVAHELGRNSVPVLLVGERGAGKRTIARRIHHEAGFPREQFLVKRCGELGVDELNSEAFRDLTLYLEEIGDMSPDCQNCLFDLLSRNGSNGSGHGDVRVICGSSRELEPDVSSRAFREDLYYRLSGVCLRIPPLRQRKEDVEHLVAFFFRRYAELFDRPTPVLTAATRKLFLEYSWPGNLSELAAAARAIVAVGDESVVMGGLRSMLTRAVGRSNGEKKSLKETARAASREAERELILKVLTQTRWNRRRAAQELQISYKALLYKLKQIGYGEYGTS
jgi:two-component system, NtrC family, response regulator AtoC